MNEWKLKTAGSEFYLSQEGTGRKALVFDEVFGERLVKLLNISEKTKEQNKNLKEPSEEFKRAYCDSGSVDVSCEACGRYHFSVGARDSYYEDYDDEAEAERDWEELLKRAITDPDEYVYHNEYGDDYISWGYLDGLQIVADCPCNRARRYEDWLWRHRYIITSYLKAMARRWIEEAKDVADLANIDATMLEIEDCKIEGRVRRPA